MLSSEQNKGKKVFLSWLEDDNIRTRNTFVYLLEQTETFVKFRTKENILTIPLSRVLKIKEELPSFDAKGGVK